METKIIRQNKVRSRVKAIEINWKKVTWTQTQSNTSWEGARRSEIRHWWYRESWETEIFIYVEVLQERWILPAQSNLKRLTHLQKRFQRPDSVRYIALNNTGISKFLEWIRLIDLLYHKFYKNAEDSLEQKARQNGLI